MKMPLFNQEKPLFHSAISSHDGFNLYLDFDKKDRLKGLFYQGEGALLESFESLAKAAEGKNFEELQSLKLDLTPSNRFFNLPLYLLKRALDSYRGKAPALYELKNEPESELLCRCFGIYKEELLETLDKNPEFGRKELTNSTKAGAGCTTCLVSFQEVFAESKSRQARKLLEK
jgi:bacterioferritin-associated ferredoxin